MTKSGFAKLIPWAAGGAGLAALENRYVGNDNLSPELKNVNLGLGALTGGSVGALLRAGKPTEAAAIAAGYPLKSMLLFGTGAMDRFRREQQNLVNTNLQTAQINQRTALTDAQNSGDKRRMALAFMIPAMLGGGGLAYYAWNKRRHAQPSRFRTVAERGSPHGRQRVRIEIPPSALPEGFFHSLVNVDDNPKAMTRVAEKFPAEPDVQEAVGNAQQFLKQQNFKDPGAVSFMAKWAAAENQHPSVLHTVGDLAAQMTGLPQLARGLREIPMAADQLSSGNYRDAGRYGLASLGNTVGGGVMAGAAVPWMIGSLLGRPRLAAGAMRSIPFAKSIYQRAFGNHLDPRIITRGGVMGTQAERRIALGLEQTGAMDRARRMAFRYDPSRFSWNMPRPGTAGADSWTSPIKRLMLGAPKTPSHTLPGKLITAGRYAANRGVDSLYRAKQFFGRHPYITANAVSWPLSGLGSVLDDKQNATAKRDLKGYLPNWEKSLGPHNMPISGAMSSMLNVFGRGQNSSAADQIQGAATDPWQQTR